MEPDIFRCISISFIFHSRLGVKSLVSCMYVFESVRKLFNHLDPSVTNCDAALPRFLPHLHYLHLLLIHAVPPIMSPFVNISSNTFRFSCWDSSLYANSNMSSAKSRTSTVSFHSLTPCTKPSLVSFTLLCPNIHSIPALPPGLSGSTTFLPPSLLPISQGLYCPHRPLNILCLL